MLGSAVSSSTPKDFQPSSHMGWADVPLMKRHGPPGLPWGFPYPAVGIQRALDSATGLPRRSMSALWMLGFLMPAEVRRYFTIPLLTDHLLCSRAVAPALANAAIRSVLGGAEV